MTENILLNLPHWIEVDLDKLLANAREVRRHLPPACQLMAVVKADAYGLGAVMVAQTLAEECQALAVTTVEEGAELRRHGLTLPILVFAPPDSQTAPLYAQYRLQATIDSPATLAALKDYDLDCHLKVDTGMHRLGCPPELASQLVAEIKASPALHLIGIYSHLAAAVKPKTAARQTAVFRQIIEELTRQGLDYGLAHLANSAALLHYPPAYFDLVRVGTALYGQATGGLPAGWSLADTWQAKARLLGIRQVAKGQLIGYGGDLRARRDLRLGIAAIGYSDGFTVEPQARPLGWASFVRQSGEAIARLLLRHPKHYALWQGRRLYPAGRVSMQLTSFDLGAADLQKGDVLDISLRRTCASSRIYRIYRKGGAIVAVRNEQGVYSTVGMEGGF